MATERQLTARLRAFFGEHRDVLVGIGDDAAVLRSKHDNQVVCCDPVIGGVHFDSHAPLPLVGRKAVNRNLSDLAAMGAHADWLVASLVVPPSFAEADILAILRGMRNAAQAASATVVGGDLASSKGPIVVTVTAIGHYRERVLTRTGAQPGDTLHVTGALGGSRMGHHLRFRPALAEGQWLARQQAVGAAIDVSDGLLLDLQTMLDASGGLGAEIEASQVPVRAAARHCANGDRRRALDSALHDGEDHVLLWAQRTGRLRAGGPLTQRARRAVGRVLEEPGIWLVDRGRRTRLASVGFQHEFGSDHRTSG